jgi:hypothetical protein
MSNPRMPAEWKRMKVRKMFVTPAMAGEWLKKNDANRGISTSRVDCYARDIANDRWGANPQPAIRNVNGGMLDAQHRMHAVVKANKGIWMLVVSGVSHEVRKTVDRNRPRTTADLVRMRNGKNATTKASACRWLHWLDGGIGMRDRVSESEVDDILSKRKREFDWLDKTKLSPAYRRSPYLAAVIWVMRLNPSAVQEFHARVSDGVGLKAGSPALAMRHHMASMQGEGGGSQAAKDLVLKTLTCVEALLDSKAVARLAASNGILDRMRKRVAAQGGGSPPARLRSDTTAGG